MEQVFRAAIESLATPNASSSGTTSVLQQQQQQQQQPGLTDTRPTKRRQVKNACSKLLVTGGKKIDLGWKKLFIYSQLSKGVQKMR